LKLEEKILQKLYYN